MSDDFGVLNRIDDQKNLHLNDQYAHGYVRGSPHSSLHDCAHASFHDCVHASVHDCVHA